MKRLNWLFTLSSLSVILVTIERFSFTGKILLQPYGFLRLHEVFQMTVLILFTTVIPFFLLRETSDNFELIKTKKGFLVGLLFITGVYFYATGNGVHEVASFAFNTYCNTVNISGEQCGSMFFNDYYFGNILYFIGAFLMNITFMIFERMKPNKNFTKKDFTPLLINSVIYSLAIFAYSAFDRVLVGLVYTLLMTAAIYPFIIWGKRKFSRMPVTAYLAITYTVGLAASLIFRFR